MFNQPLGRLESIRRFEDRKWQKSESFSDYCHSKVTLGNQVPIADEEIIDYVINGIPSETLQNQARMNSFASIPELLKVFQRIKLSTSGVGTTKQETSAGRTARYKSYNKIEDIRAPANKKTTGNVKPVMREKSDVTSVKNRVTMQGISLRSRGSKVLLKFRPVRSLSQNGPIDG